MLSKLRGNDRFKIYSEGDSRIQLLVTRNVGFLFFLDYSLVFLSILFQCFCRRCFVRFWCLGRAVCVSLPVSNCHFLIHPLCHPISFPSSLRVHSCFQVSRDQGSFLLITGDDDAFCPEASWGTASYI